MGEIIIKSKTIAVPNIRYNTYECFRKTGFWASDKTYIRAKDRDNECSKEIKEYKDIYWNCINKEFDLISWFFNVGISKKDFEYMKTKEFCEQEKGYLGTNISDINTIPTSYIGEIIKKHWALELWKWYNNYYRLTGIGTFKMMGDEPIHVWGDTLGLNSNRIRKDYRWVGADYTSQPQAYQWEWPEKYGLLH